METVLLRILAISVALALPAAAAAQELKFNVVQETLELKPSDILEAEQSFQDGQPIVRIKLAPDAAKRFGEITSRNLRKPMQVVVGDRILTTPIIQSAIMRGEIVISGRLTVAEAAELARKLKP